MSEFAEEYQTSILTKEGLFTLKEYRDEKELEKLVVSNASHIFGSNSIYFDIKHRIESKAKMRITDGLLLDLTNKMFWIVEHELSKHDPYKEIEPQISGFIRAIAKEETINKVSSTVYNELKKNPKHLSLAKEALGEEVYYSITNMLRDKCGILIVIDKVTPQIEELREEFSDKMQTRLIEFKTYEKDSELIYAYTPLKFESKRIIPTAIDKTYFSPTDETIDIIIERIHSAKKYALIPIPRKFRRFFPSYKVNFILETDVGEIETRVTSAKKGTPDGDPTAGNYIQSNLRKWFSKHPELNDGSILRIKTINPKKRYRLSIFH